jgi:hypothetical protein
VIVSGADATVRSEGAVEQVVSLDDIVATLSVP